MPKRVDHGVRRREIADAVGRITVRGGLAAATFREVAAEAGVSVRLIQYYFGSKAELMLATQRRVSERAVARIQARRAGGGESPREVLLAVLGSFIPTDDESREIMLLFVALHTATLVDPTLFRSEAQETPRALQAAIAAQLDRADLAGRPVGAEAAILAGLVPSLAQAVLDGLDTAETAREVLAYAIDRALGEVPP
ncbi:MAG TPA: TetR/AcrR family transcriptional regulator [Acidimicrobiales bacterium]|nr:TetR/AcrR family transcriptional regulator [Acidimicrobiales bacterium]